MTRGAGQRGSALLIVFVFAAVIAILLYREMPVAVFEAHRQKEELLIDRGNEYKHAIKLFVRKTGTFPPSIEALESTNRMRFLRHKFEDPFTGKADWRMLHAGPGGMIIDSKVNTNKSGVDANGKPVAGNTGTSGSGSNTGFGASTNSTFGQPSSGFGSNSDNNSTTPEVTVAAVPQRAPAIAANGSSAVAPNNDLSVTPGESGQPTGQPTGQSDASVLPVGGIHSPEGAVVQADTPGAGATPAGANGGRDPQGLMRSMLNSPQNPQTPQQQRPSSSTMGAINSGGIAGVASKASGHSIKLVNDQDNYTLWEFYYDMTKEANAALAAAQGPPSRIGNNMMNGNGAANPSANSAFGSSNGFSLSNGNSNTMGNPNPAPATGPQPVPNQ